MDPARRNLSSLRLLATLFVLSVLSGCGRSSLAVDVDASFDGPSGDALSCSETTCPRGCCTAEGKCVDGTGNAACGSAGDLCAVCPSGESCSAGSRMCVGPGACSMLNCPAGCCDQSDRCQLGSAVTACGTAGHACENCPAEGFTTCDVAHECESVSTGCDATS